METDISNVKPMFTVIYSNYAWGYQRSWVLVDNTGTKHTIVGKYPTPNFNTPVSQWWPSLYEYITNGKPEASPFDFMASGRELRIVSEPCPQFEQLCELFSKINKKPVIEMYDTGMRDGGGVSCYGIFGEETWMLEDHGCGASINTDPNVNAFCDAVYTHVYHDGHLNQFYMHHHPTIRCPKNHPVSDLTQQKLVERHFGQYNNGYVCDECRSHETVTNTLHCVRCGYDLCPSCVSRKLAQ